MADQRYCNSYAVALTDAAAHTVTPAKRTAQAQHHGRKFERVVLPLLPRPKPREAGYPRSDSAHALFELVAQTPLAAQHPRDRKS